MHLHGKYICFPSISYDVSFGWTPLIACPLAYDLYEATNWERYPSSGIEMTSESEGDRGSACLSLFAALEAEMLGATKGMYLSHVADQIQELKRFYSIQLCHNPRQLTYVRAVSPPSLRPCFRAEDDMQDHPSGITRATCYYWSEMVGPFSASYACYLPH